MSDLAFWPRLLLAVLATWRATHLIAREDGPGDVLVRLRQRLGLGLFGRLMDCFYCLSLWVALPLTLVVTGGPHGNAATWLAEFVVTWLALSGAACLLERATDAPLVVQPGDDDRAQARGEREGE